MSSDWYFIRARGLRTSCSGHSFDGYNPGSPFLRRTAHEVNFHGEGLENAPESTVNTQ